MGRRVKGERVTFNVSEIFDSIQGEGALTGMPSTFVRLARCNLSCSWCDAAYTWKGNVTFEEVALEALLARVEQKHVVLTGGEPTFSDGFVELVAALRHDGHHVTVETNGTIWHDAAMEHVKLWSVSPKLGSSEQRGRLNLGVLRNYAMLATGRTQFKFVVDGEDDFQQTLTLLRDLQLSDTFGHRVFMQPNGLCHTVIASANFGKVRLTEMTERSHGDFPGAIATIDGPYPAIALETPYLDRLRWLYERVIQAEVDGEAPVSIRAVAQAHKLAWGNRRGF